MDFKDRLRYAMRGAGVTQTQLAESIGVNQSAVSQWVNGQRQPDVATVTLLAHELETSTEWLQHGRGGPPAAARRQELERLRTEVVWTPRPLPEDGAREGGNANQFTIHASVGNLVREAIQNSVDEWLGPPHPPVRMLFRLVSLRGEAKDRYLEALRWDQLESHVAASVEEAPNQQVGGALREALEIAALGELLVLQIADFNTRGLIGPEKGRGNFAALTRDNLFSEKATDVAGGSYGLGKAMQHAASAFNTVLFLSNLCEPEPETGKAAGRFFGRADLLYHEHDEGDPPACAGPAWLGRRRSPETYDPTSYWADGNEDLLLHQLQMTRANGVTGTTIAIVGFRDPDADRPRSPREIIQQIEEEIARYFWPAIVADELNASVEYVELSRSDAKPRPEVDTVVAPEQSSEVGPFVHALGAHHAGEVDDVLIDEGDAAYAEVELHVPARKDGTHEAFTHRATLIVRRATADEMLDERTMMSSGQAALMRGSNMVIKHLDVRRSAVGALPFHAMVLAGLAAGDLDENRFAEEFLRAAEPPSHDDWTSTTRLRYQYNPGWKKALMDFEAAIKRELRRILALEVEHTPDGPRDLARRFRFGEPPDPPERAPRVTVQSHIVEEDGAWRIEATIRLRGDLEKPVVGRPQLVFLGESGGRSRVRWAGLEAVKNCSVSDGALVIPPQARSARFRALSDSTTHPAPGKEVVATMIFQPVRAEV